MVEATASPGVVLVALGIRMEFHLVFIGAAAIAELTVDNETPSLVLGTGVTVTISKKRV